MRSATTKDQVLDTLTQVVGELEGLLKDRKFPIIPKTGAARSEACDSVHNSY